MGIPSLRKAKVVRKRFQKFLPILSLCVLLPLPAVAQVQGPVEQGLIRLTVDAKNNCVDLRSKTVGYAKTSIHPGEYQVSVISNANYRESELNMKKVAFYNTSDDQPYGWFFVVDEERPIIITVSGIGLLSDQIFAFFIDANCSDNTGSVTLTFQPR